MRRVGVLIVAVLLASSCSSIPIDGQVQTGGAKVVAEQPVVPIVVNPPGPDDDPVATVDGFLRASAAGVAGDFGGARTFLSVQAGRSWDPRAQVTIFSNTDITAVWDEDDGTVTYSIPVAATVDETGRMTEVEPGTREPFVFTVTRSVFEQWRIARLDDGILVSEANFNALYRPVVLTYVGSDGEVIVPDVRWLPEENVVTHAASALIRGAVAC